MTTLVLGMQDPKMLQKDNVYRKLFTGHSLAYCLENPDQVHSLCLKLNQSHVRSRVDNQIGQCVQNHIRVCD